MADRELRVLILGDSSSLQGATQKAEVSVGNFETRMKNAVIVTGEAGALSDGLARKMNSLEQLGLTPASVGMIGLAASAGLVAHEVTTLIDRSEKLTGAYDNLNNAIADNGYNQVVATTNLQSFLDTNKRYITDQAVVIDGYANMLRAGVPVNNLQRDLMLSLDLSVSRHQDLAVTMQAVTDAELGRTLGLVKMGVNVKDLNALTVDQTKDTSEYNKAVLAAEVATKAHANAVQMLANWESLHYGIKTRTQAQYIQETALRQKVTETTNAQTDAVAKETAAHASLSSAIDKTNLGLTEAAAKYDGAHKNLSQLNQAQNDLNHSQDDFAQKYGPAMAGALANGLDIVNLSVQAISILAKDTNDFLGGLGDWLKNTRGASGQGHSLAPGGASIQLPSNVTTGTDRNAANTAADAAAAHLAELQAQTAMLNQIAYNTATAKFGTSAYSRS